ncbi:GNAT family N-acetyltransferase [Clostridium bovifaecis]|uniref:GNAT family N-acetyltransferase n=1 Tax=Clostridium bovifaecis TaxID=2184719 RepID=A0A6I6EYF7_9CLOT|nr:GNAT family N-acetyltransferase [Clostridium bovifaecis]
MKRLSNEQKYKIVVECTPEYDGIFYYGVKSTKIFCRPSCKSKTPLSKNLTYFYDIFDAYNNGFRPCKRCRPDLSKDGNSQILNAVNEVKNSIDTNFSKNVSIQTLLSKFAINEFYLARLFKKHYGCTPHEYLIQIRLQKSMEYLKTTNRSITEIAYCTGFNSLSSFYVNFKKHIKVTPKEYRKMKGGIKMQILNINGSQKELKIVKGEPKHSEHISYLGKTTFRETFGYLFNPKTLDNYLETTFNSKKIKKSIEQSKNHFLIVYLDNEPIGYAKIKEDSTYEGIDSSKNQLQLQKIYLLSSYHRLGIGTIMMECCKDIFNKFSPITVWLDVHEDNIKAINYYEKCGFKKIGKYYYSFEDASFTYHAMALDV